jgi:hypothetical protein
MSWVLVPCLVALRGEFNDVSPGRDKSSDGSIGDRRHATTVSDHNADESGATPYEDADNVDEVHAIDVDDTGPWPSAGWFDRQVDAIVARHRAGQDDRLQNVIRNGRIASRSWGWTWKPYNGANPHDHHAHFSARYTTAQENDTSPWGILEEDEMTKAEFLALLRDGDVRKALATAVLSTDGVIPAPDGSLNADKTPNTHWAAASYLSGAYKAAVSARTYSAEARTGVAQLAGKDFTDEPAIIRGVLSGLPAAQIAAAIPTDIARQVAQELAARLQS